MSAHALVSGWRSASGLPAAPQVTTPLPSRLRNEGSPAYALRSANGRKLRKKGSAYDMREFSDATTSVGHIFFHPGTREPPIPPFAELQAFAAANPDLPIVVDDERKDPCEDPHIVFACLVQEFDMAAGRSKVGLDRDGNVLIRLYTIAADCNGRAFDPATHVKDGDQKEGVDIFNWEMVNFDSEYRRNSLCETYRCIYRDLRSVAMC